MAASAPIPHQPPHPRPVVVVTEPLAPAPAAWLAERAEVVRVGPWDDPAAWTDAAGRADGLVVRTRGRWDAAVLDASPNLRVLGRAGVGIDHIDLAACAARGVAVVHTPDANADAVCEFVTAALFDAIRPRRYLSEPHTAAQWEALRAELIAPRQLNTLTVGVLGLGRVGSRVARVIHAFGARTIGHDIDPAVQPDNVELVSRDVLFATADVISVHIDGRPANHGVLNTDVFARMKPDVTFINTSRGFVVDAHALAAFMTAHPNATAVLDVHPDEPFDASYPLLGIAGARLTPHIASATATAKEAMSWVVRDVMAVLDGAAPRWPADPTTQGT